MIADSRGSRIAQSSLIETGPQPRVGDRLLFEALVMYRTFSSHRFFLCSGLNVVGHVDSVLDSVVELRALSFISFGFVGHLSGGVFEALYVC